MSSAVVYVRVSTEQQAESGLSPEAQEDACARWCKARQMGVSRVCRDLGLSGSLPLDKRPGLVEAIAHLRKGDVLLVAKRDRVFRADPFERAMIERAVTDRGARIVSVAGEGTEDDEPSSQLMRQILDCFACYERLIIAARTQAIMAWKRMKSERLGEIPYGYSLKADGRTLVASEHEMAVAERVVHMRSQGHGFRQIARALNDESIPAKRGGEWTHVTVKRVIERYGSC